MSYTPVPASAHRLPEDEIIRKHFEVPPWWDSAVSLRDQRRPVVKINCRGARAMVEAELRKKPWQTLKELVEILSFHEKTITEAVRLGFGAGRLVRRQRKGREFEYAVLLGTDNGKP